MLKTTETDIYKHWKSTAISQQMCRSVRHFYSGIFSIHWTIRGSLSKHQWGFVQPYFLLPPASAAVSMLNCLCPDIFQVHYIGYILSFFMVAISNFKN